MKTGFVLCSGSAPRLRRAQPLRLKRAAPLPWAFMLRQLRSGRSATEVAGAAAGRFFALEPLMLGVEATARRAVAELPCGQRTDTGRARLVRRQKNPFPACRSCALREECLALSPQPTLLWQWQRLGLLDRSLLLTPRGEIVSFFLGPEGLALAAALDDVRYPLDELVFDCANLFAGDRFSGTNPRTLGRLARVCEQTYRRFTAEGWLDHGLPPQYGCGAAEIVRALVEQKARRGELAAASEFAGRGDIDRLLTEWRSLLRHGGPRSFAGASGDGGPGRARARGALGRFSRALPHTTRGDPRRRAAGAAAADPGAAPPREPPLLPGACTCRSLAAHPAEPSSGCICRLTVASGARSCGTDILPVDARQATGARPGLRRRLPPSPRLRRTRRRAARPCHSRHRRSGDVAPSSRVRTFGSALPHGSGMD